MDRFEFSNSQLYSNEEVILKETNIRLYDGETKSSFEKGTLSVTTHRLLWCASSDGYHDQICLTLPLRFIVFIQDDPPGPFAFTRSHKVILHLANVTDKTPGPVPTSNNNYIKISFRDGLNNSNFIQTLNNLISERKWEQGANLGSTSPTKSNMQKQLNIKTRTGIVGIERNLEEQQKATGQSIAQAFRDLNKLMVMAKDMVRISQSISAKIRDKQGDISEDETVKFKSYLMSLGIDDPVTRDSFKTDNDYFTNLAIQIANLMSESIREVGGIMSLTDVYCRVNRARGLELLSPEDLLRACKILDHISDASVRLHEFESGTMVLKLTSLDDSSIANETEDILWEKGNITAEKLAQDLGISVLMAKERLLVTEKYGKACRDDSMEGLIFYPNRFLIEE